MKKLFLLALILAMCLSLCACAPAVESVPTTPPTIKVTEPPTEPAPSLPSSKAARVDLFLTAVENMLNENYDVVMVMGDETKIQIGVAESGFGAKVYKMKLEGHGENHSDWVAVKDSMLKLYDSIYDLAQTYDVEDIPITLFALNDQNVNTGFLGIRDGAIFYDVMAG